MKVESLLEVNRKCEDAIFVAMGKSIPSQVRERGRLVAKAELAHFAKPLLAELKAFISVRVSKSIQEIKKLPGKGNLLEAETGGISAISVEFSKRNSKVILEVAPAQAPPAAPTATAAAAAVTIFGSAAPPQATLAYIKGKLAKLPKPSALLADGGLMRRVDDSFSGCALDKGDRKSSPMDGDRADALLNIMAVRLLAHFEERAPGKLCHWCIGWFILQLPVLCAVAIHFNHIKQDGKFTIDLAATLKCNGS